VAREYVITEDGKRFLVTREEIGGITGEVLIEVGENGESITKPDGTPIDPAGFVPSNANRGSARLQDSRAVTGSETSETSATFNPNVLREVEQDPTKTGLNQSFRSSEPSPTGPPFDNILEGFSTYNSLWTIACLEPNQFNNPSTYRDSPANLNNIVLSSAGRYDEKRTPTINGSPEYFIDNVSINAVMTPVSSGNTNATKFTFDVYEPYSMGLFLQSLQTAAIGAGYPNYLGQVPYLLKLDFIGNTDDGNLSSTITAFTKYFTLKFTNISQEVDASGSRYTVEAVPFHHTGYSDTIDNTKTDIKLTGGSVAEVLASGENSLANYLNTLEKEHIKSKIKEVPDIYEIVFPENESDNLGKVTSSTPFSFGAVLNPKELLRSAISGSSSQSSSNIGGNPISDSLMNFSAEVGGNYVKPKEENVIDERTGITDTSKVKIDPTVREFKFSPEGEKITRIIQKVILVSNYAAAATDAKNLKNGMVNWFRLDLQIQLLDYDRLRGVRAKKFTYRVLPYLVDGSVLKNPSAPMPGLSEIEKIIAKRYDYIYSGRNNNILNLNLQFNSMFYTGASPRPFELNGLNNPDINNASDTETKGAGVNAGNTTAVTSASGAATVGPDEEAIASSATGSKSIQEQVADVFSRRFQTSSADMVNVEMEILGDPYFLTDSGLNSNYFAPQGINKQITGDNSLNYEGTDVFVYIAFRTPVEPNLSVSNEGGLYEFPDGGKESPYSGIYKVTKIENKFSNGNFTQVMQLLRPQGQPQDLVGQEAIVKENVSLYGQIFTVPPSSTPAADANTQEAQEGVSSLDGLLDTVAGAVDTVSGVVNTGLGAYQSVNNIISNVSSGNISGAIGGVGSAFGGISSTLNSLSGSSDRKVSSSTAANENLRPTSQRASSVSQTTSSAAQTVTRFDVSGVQRAARNNAIQRTLDSGGTIQQAEAAGQVAGNLAGTEALRNIKL